MDYIKLLNGFDRWLECNALPIASQLLWYRLAAKANRAGWPEWVQVGNHELMAMVQVTRLATFTEKIRGPLIENHLIEYQKGKRGSPGRYRLILQERFPASSRPRTPPLAADKEPAPFSGRGERPPSEARPWEPQREPPSGSETGRIPGPLNCAPAPKTAKMAGSGPVSANPAGYFGEIKGGTKAIWGTAPLGPSLGDDAGKAGEMAMTGPVSESPAGYFGEIKGGVKANWGTAPLGSFLEDDAGKAGERVMPDPVSASPAGKPGEMAMPGLVSANPAGYFGEIKGGVKANWGTAPLGPSVEDGAGEAGEKVMSGPVSESLAVNPGEKAMSGLASASPAGKPGEKAMPGSVSENPAGNFGEIKGGVKANWGTAPLGPSLEDGAGEAGEKAMSGSVSANPAGESGERVMSNPGSESLAVNPGEKAMPDLVSASPAGKPGEMAMTGPVSASPAGYLGEIKGGTKANWGTAPLGPSLGYSAEKFGERAISGLGSTHPAGDFHRAGDGFTNHLEDSSTPGEPVSMAESVTNPVTSPGSNPGSNPGTLYKKKPNKTKSDLFSPAGKEDEEAVFQKITDGYHRLCVCVGYPRLTALSQSRKAALRARLDQGYSLQDFERLFSMARDSPYLMGENPRGWHADFDWLIQDAKMPLVLEGKYSAKKPPAPPQEAAPRHSFNLEEIDQWALYHTPRVRPAE